MRSLALALGLLLAASSARAEPLAIKDGDLIFHRSASSQSEAIRLATGSELTHVGIVVFDEGAPFVLEAIGPVQLTPLSAFVKRGVGGKFEVKRLADHPAGLDRAERARMEHLARLKYVGKPYDYVFGWGDDRIYCSELVYKLFLEGLGKDLGPKRRLRDFDLSSGPVAKLIAARYGSAVPLDEPVIAPADLARSIELVTVAVED